MASLHQQKGNRPGYKIRWRDGNKQRVLWIGDLSVRSANTVFRHVSELIAAKSVGTRPEPDTERWSTTLTGRLRSKLVEFGLIDSAEPATQERLLGPFIDSVINSMVDAEPRTIRNYNQTKGWLVRYFGDKPLIDITVADMENWHRHIKSKLPSVSTRNKHVQRCKKFFSVAVDAKILAESPAAKLKRETPPRVDRSRQAFVDEALTKEVIEGLPSGDIRLTFVLARYLGLRRCEIFVLKWTDVDWDRERIRIDSPKTGERTCPIFQPVMDYLREAFEQAPEGAVKIIRRFHSDDSITTLMLKHIKRVIGKERVWPKIMHQLRSTRRTELEEQFPNHVVNEWIGHDGRTAEQHYLQVTPDHWDKAKASNVHERERSKCVG